MATVATSRQLMRAISNIYQHQQTLKSTTSEIMMGISVDTGSVFCNTTSKINFKIFILFSFVRSNLFWSFRNDKILGKLAKKND